MNKKIALCCCLFVASCALVSGGEGQVVFHWEKPYTGVEKFSRDHAECLKAGETLSFIPDFRTWFYSEETKLNTRADWKSSSGIWATYVPYPGAQPLIINSRYDDKDISPSRYSACMHSKWYRKRTHDIPEITNINLYRRDAHFWSKWFR